jgi:hypothetical protein
MLPGMTTRSLSLAGRVICGRDNNPIVAALAGAANAAPTPNAKSVNSIFAVLVPRVRVDLNFTKTPP